MHAQLEADTKGPRIRPMAKQQNRNLITDKLDSFQFRLKSQSIYLFFCFGCNGRSHEELRGRRRKEELRGVK